MAAAETGLSLMLTKNGTRLGVVVGAVGAYDVPEANNIDKMNVRIAVRFIVMVGKGSFGFDDCTVCVLCCCIERRSCRTLIL